MKRALVVAVILMLGCKQRGPAPEAAERVLGAGAVCSLPSGNVVMCVRDGRLVACVQNRRGDVACAPARANVPAEAP